MEKYDSTLDTTQHILDVRMFISNFCQEMARRATVHDQSKLESPEKEIFDKYTPILRELEYGSPEYFKNLENIKVATDHHYANNTHHPQHYSNGINGFDLFDLVEMFCDWQAAVSRTKEGDMMKSVEINSNRFEMGEVLTNIFNNTINRLK